MNTEHRFLSRAPQFEPPATGAARPSRTTVAAAARRSPHSGRSPRNGSAPVTADSTRPASDARRFAEHALRLTLEVLDRRRPPTQLRPLLTPAVHDLVQTLARSAPAGTHLGTATLARVHVRPVHHQAAEVFGTYNRGGRVFAVAARIERGNSRHPAGWAITSLRIA
ncbi:hypothetical protein ERC79_04655 [Rhodococcus sp. ABRD24]|uniref:Rv3235 family protein n=1 Tax=Rhodococcus sp. ABRD24 TaxID=2507582 RepID=UPI00103FB53F|nr:Rv3235 family protein [Rhodococcus sp. ABRD24]QBJ95321.1 hypothetical protein ERC79_04655 [Rhodococcus sp. ABRD24]